MSRLDSQRWVQAATVPNGIQKLIDKEIKDLLTKYPVPYNSWHEAYAVIKEELEEFWESVRENNPDPEELVQLCATAYCALMQLCGQAALEAAGGEAERPRW